MQKDHAVTECYIAESERRYLIRISWRFWSMIKKENKQIKNKNQDLYSGTETLVTWWFIFDRYHSKRNSLITQSPGVIMQVLMPIAQMGFPLTAAGKLRGDARFPLSRGFLQLSFHCFPLKALLLGNRELFQSLKFKVHFMKSPFLVYSSDGRGY